MNKISLAQMEYHKADRKLTLASEPFGMPCEFEVISHHTGEVVKFAAITYGDPLYDEDGWDGEQKIYRPTHYVKNVEYAVIYNQY